MLPENAPSVNLAVQLDLIGLADALHYGRQGIDTPAVEPQKLRLADRLTVRTPRTIVGFRKKGDVISPL
jgi:hypothetical protein